MFKLKNFLVIILCFCFMPCYSFSEISLDNYDCDLDNSEDIQDFNDIQELYNKNKDWNNLIKLYNICIKNNSDEEFLYNNRARINMNLKKYENALTDYDKALEIKNNDIFALYGRMSVFIIQKKLDEALNISKKIIEINPDFVGVYFRKGEIYFAQKNYKKAIENFRECLFKAQNTPKWKMDLMNFSVGDINYNLGIAYYEDNNNKKALNYFQNALEYYKFEKDEKNIEQVKETINKLK